MKYICLMPRLPQQFGDTCPRRLSHVNWTNVTFGVPGMAHLRVATFGGFSFPWRTGITDDAKANVEEKVQ